MDNSDNDFKLVGNDNKYLTVVNTTGEMTPVLKPKQHELNQTFSYNAQGDLIFDNKCLTYNVKNQNIYFDSCDAKKKIALSDNIPATFLSKAENKNKNKKWIIANNNVSPSNDLNKCLESGENDNVLIGNCNDSDEQIWIIEDTDDIESDYALNKYHGKTVVLVESDNPWYINQDVTIPQKMGNGKLNLYDIAKYRDNSNFKSTRILDSESPNLGLGNSYADRLGTKCNRIENFGEYKNNNYQILICIIIIIIIFLLLKK